MVGQMVPYRALGCQSSLELLQQCPEVVEVRQLEDGNTLLVSHCMPWWRRPSGSLRFINVGRPRSASCVSLPFRLTMPLTLRPAIEAHHAEPWFFQMSCITNARSHSAGERSCAAGAKRTWAC